MFQNVPEPLSKQPQLKNKKDRERDGQDAIYGAKEGSVLTHFLTYNARDVSEHFPLSFPPIILHLSLLLLVI